MYCIKCGFLIQDDSKFCVNCGVLCDEGISIQGQSMTKLNNKIGRRIDMDTKNLWGTLVQYGTKFEALCPPGLQVTIDEYFSTLTTLIRENNLPAEAEMFNITWDDTSLSQKRILVKYTGNEIILHKDIKQILIGLDQFGNYSYVEFKVFIEKPILPKTPRKKDNTPRPVIDPVGAGIGLLLDIVPGVIYMASKQKKKKKWDETIGKENLIAEKEQRDWDAAWSAWEKEVLNAVYLNSTNDIYGRFINAITGIVKMTNKILFEDRKAAIRESIEKDIKEQQLRDEIAKRKDEFK